jgi:hypothetical protein
MVVNIDKRFVIHSSEISNLAAAPPTNVDRVR